MPGVALAPSSMPPVWLLTVQFAGREYLFASEAVEVLDSDGRVRRFDAQLPDTPWEEVLNLFSADAQVPTLSFSLFWPDDVALLVAQGHELSAATAEYSLHIPGDAWEQRVLLLAGIVDQPTFGAFDEPVAFSVREDLREDRALWPPSSATITAQAWPDADPSSVGKCYPWPFGSAGVYTEYDGSPGETSGSPAYVVDVTNNLVLVAYGETHAAAVTLIDATNDASEVFTRASGKLYTGTDGLGQTVTLVDTSSAGTIDPAIEDVELWARWHSGGAAMNRDRSGPLVGAGEILSFLAGRSSLPYDLAAFRGLEEYLNRFELAGCIADHVGPTQWIRDHLLPILPLSITAGPRGRRPVLWRYDATVDDAVEHLEEGRNFTRSGPLAYERSEIANEIVLRFAKRARTSGEYHRMRGVTGRPDAPYTSEAGVRRSDWFTTTHSRASVQAVAAATGTDGVLVLELRSDVISSSVTADLVLLWMSAALAFPWVRARGDSDLPLARLAPGQGVALTAADVHLARRLALVVGAVLTPTGVGVTLRVQRRPTRDPVPTS